MKEYGFLYFMGAVFVLAMVVIIYGQNNRGKPSEYDLMIARCEAKSGVVLARTHRIGKKNHYEYTCVKKEFIIEP